MGIGAIISMLFGFFNKSDTGAKVGGGLANAATIAAAVPILIGVYKWFEGHKADVFWQPPAITYGDAIIVGLVVFAIVEVIRATRPRAQ